MVASKIEQRIRELELRNARVESDKAWETSFARRALLTIFTYVSVGAYLQAIGLQNAWLHTIVPAVAFVLSTLALPFLRKLFFRA